MNRKTVTELRALAKRLGLKGYSRLSKEELLQRLQAAKAEDDSVVRSASVTQKDTVETRNTARAPRSAIEPTAVKKEKPAARPEPAGDASAAPMPAPASDSAPPANPVWWEPPRQIGPRDTHFATQEELVEGAKYAFAPEEQPRTPELTDLGEDTERLPELRAPALYLLPQKPGVLHAYWSVPPTELQRYTLKLRLCRTGMERLEVWQEWALPSARGTWYFHVHEVVASAEMLLQVGYYEGGRFVSPFPGGIARVPNLYAAARTDAAWRIAEEDFRKLYLGAGGFEAAARGYGWSASMGSSPGPAAPGPGGERLGWPGGISSR